jgi:hypothetical protein
VGPAIRDLPVKRVVIVVIPAMWSPRFRLVAQRRNGNPSERETAQEM